MMLITREVVGFSFNEVESAVVKKTRLRSQCHLARILDLPLTTYGLNE